LFQVSQEPGEPSDVALGYELDDRTFKSRQGLGLFLFTTASKPNLLSNWYQGLIPWG